jgi:hypothetical protein
MDSAFYHASLGSPRLYDSFTKRLEEVTWMEDLEEALNRHYYLVDSWYVRFQHILMIVSTLLIFSAYSIFLWLLCSLSANVITSLLLLGSQIGLGIPLTRAYYDFGLSTRNRMSFFDSGIHDNSDETFELKVNFGDMPLFFERMGLQVKKYDNTKFDDLTDLSWFIIIAWAIISSGAYFTNMLGQFLWFLGVVFSLSACMMCYASGYWTNRGNSFEEDIDHLEYYIDTLLKMLDAVLPDLNGTAILQLKCQKRKSVLVDIAALFKLRDSIALEYHFGLSSNLQERFILEASDIIIETAYMQLSNLHAISDSGWNLEQVKTKTGYILRIINPCSNLNLANRSTFVTSPSVVERNSRVPREILSSIVLVIK